LSISLFFPAPQRRNERTHTYFLVVYTATATGRSHEESQVVGREDKKEEDLSTQNENITSLTTSNSFNLPFLPLPKIFYQ
jgi:hypothetical protein